METPYRLQQLVEIIAKIFSNQVYLVLAYKLTMKEEHIYRGKASEILKKIKQNKLKGEFVLIIDNK
jgi:16S rRNA C1402 (ribose-2'-O) methylase RsmI